MDPIEFIIIGITIAIILFLAMRLFILPIRTLELSIKDEHETPAAMRQPWHERFPSNPVESKWRVFEPVPLPVVTVAEEKAPREKGFEEVVITRNEFKVIPHASKN